MPKTPRTAALEKTRANAETIDRGLKDFGRSAKVFSAKPLIQRYEDQWVAAYKGKIVASGKSLAAVRKALLGKNISLSDAMIRRVERNERTFIL